MKTEKKTITIDKQAHEIEVEEFESFDELMLKVSAGEILDAFNYRFKQLQCMAGKKRLKPRHITIKEKRTHAFNLFSEEELAETTNNPARFEAYMVEKLVIVEQKIKDKEII